MSFVSIPCIVDRYAHPKRHVSHLEKSSDVASGEMQDSARVLECTETQMGIKRGEIRRAITAH